MRILSAAQVNTILDQFQVDDYLDLSRRALVALSNKGSALSLCPARNVVEHNNFTSLHMPSLLDGIVVEKVVCVPTSSKGSGLDASIIVLDQESGAVKCLMNATRLTALRTASASLCATLLLKREHPDWQPLSLLIFGSGEQAYQHARLHLIAIKSLTTLEIVARSETSRYLKLLEQLKSEFPHVTVTGNWSIAPSDTEADIICCCTPSKAPLFSRSMLGESTKVRQLNLIGSYKPIMVEVDPEIFRLVDTVLVDSKEACESEAGELLAAMAHGHLRSEQLIELGSVLDSERNSSSKISPRTGRLGIYKSVGSGIMDDSIAQAVHQKAKAMNLGTVITDY